MAVICVCTRKTFNLGVEDQLRDLWAFRNGKWRQLKPNYQDEPWFEDYQYGMAETKDMLECWLQYLPGCVDWDDYGDFSVTFDMGDVGEAGWGVHRLRDVLGDMSQFVKMRRVIHGDPPWLTYSTDAYGHRYNYYRHSAIDPLEGMLHVDFPRDLDPSA
jgi:hypothetical protein